MMLLGHVGQLLLMKISKIFENICACAVKSPPIAKGLYVVKFLEFWFSQKGLGEKFWSLQKINPQTI